jgi:hypothetical protein
LAMCCLFNYASLANRFKSKEALIDFLDYLFASKKIDSEWLPKPEILHEYVVRDEFPFIQRMKMLKQHFSSMSEEDFFIG